MLQKVTFKHILGLIILGFFGYLLMSLVDHSIPEQNKEIVIHILGILEGAVLMMMSYHWGSSAGSKQKSEALKDIASKNQDNAN